MVTGTFTPRIQFVRGIDGVRLASVRNENADSWGIVANTDESIPMSSDVNKHALCVLHLC